LDTDFARTLIAVIESGSIAEASRRLSLTPGAVALRIKTLEEQLGALLLERSGRRVAPTSAAMRLMPSLRTLISTANELHTIARNDQIVAGELRLGSIATASTGVLPPLLSRLTRQHPELDIFIEPGTSVGLRRRVMEGALDAAIVVPPDTLRKGEAFTPWISEPLVLIAPPGTRSTNPIALLESETFIRFDRESSGGRIVDDYLRRNGFVPHERFELDALNGIVALVSAGLGISIIPDWDGPRPQGTPVVTLPLPKPVPERVVGLYSQRSPLRRGLVDLVAATFEDMRAVKPKRSRRDRV
jgi:DNA-binding transcriptional LysR family regulator